MSMYSRMMARRRARERREETREAREAITTHTTDATGRAVHMIGWTADQVARWRRGERV